MNALLLSLLLIAAPSASPAGASPAAPVPGGPALAPFEGLEFRPVVGDWVEYEMRAKGEPTKKIKVSVVGEETEPVLAHWLEFSVRSGASHFILKMLTVGHPGAPGAIRKLIVQLGPGMVLDFPLPPEEPGASVPPPPRKAGKATPVKTRAGVFRARKVELSGARSYICDEVPIFGLVKSNSHGNDLELVAHGKGAKTEVHGIPQRMGIPLLPSGWGAAPSGSDPLQPPGASEGAPPVPPPGEAPEGPAERSAPKQGGQPAAPGSRP